MKIKNYRSLLFCSVIIFGICTQAFALELHNAINAFASKLHQKIDAKISKDIRDFEWDIFGYATKVVNIDGIGNVTYKLSKSGGRVHSYKIESDKFHISFLGNTYEVRKVNVPELKLELEIYEDLSGTFVKKDGWEYTNNGVYVLGRGYSSDVALDTLWIRYHNNFFIYAGVNTGRPIDGIGNKYVSIWEALNGTKMFVCAYPKNHEQLTQICEKLGIAPASISWKDTSDSVIEWLEKNVLAFLN